MSQESTLIADFFQSDPSCEYLRTGLASVPQFLKEVQTKSNLVQLALLQSLDNPSHHLMVVNTHLYYHPKGDHVRLMQVAVLMEYLRISMSKFSVALGKEGDKMATVLGGDLNSCPCIAAYQYLVSGRVEREHQDWRGYRIKGKPPQCLCYKAHNSTSALPEGAGTEDQYFPPHIKLQEPAVDDTLHTFEGLELRHDFRLQNVTGVENCTNFTGSFKAVLDYIMINTEHLELDKLVPLPSVNELSEFVALPSVYFPSDHVALVANIKWKS